ncbi:DUF3445 domain-containing protein [Kovacikia minuta CCNUW1]|uniref:heme-dependent oxidative N-demethylase family protein n=1 Tax=Kovacikia minuta TaxID=2931930 RepID=UPI001CCE7C34|nr:DUF3445 domain-containing protein [Kovacikia minuta]UBF27361.1 DUF3445 domain-containing protein [Kovacikia minuta CCNUW1]
MQQRIYLPFVDRSSRLSMNLKPLSFEDWIEIDENFAFYLDCKRQLLEQCYAEVFASLPETQVAQTEVLDLLLEYLLVHFPQHYCQRGNQIENLITNEVWRIEDFSENPLDLAGRLVQEDLCLLQLKSGRYQLNAASLCFPNHWRLHDKLGKPLAHIHEPVPGYAKDLEQPVDHLFDRLKFDHPVYRLNWGIADTPELFRGYVPDKTQKPDVSTLTVTNAGEKLWLRIERQTLRRLEKSRDILFMIRTYLYPLAILENDPIAARNLEKAIQQLSPEMQAYKNILPFREILLKYLAIATSTPASSFVPKASY